MPRIRIPEHHLQGIAKLLCGPWSFLLGTNYDSEVAELRLAELFAAGNLPEGFLHPYGFFVIHVARFEDSSAIRLHLWPPGDRARQEPEWPLHSHVWDLRSIVLTGRLRHVVWRLVPGSDYRLYEVGYSDTASDLVRTESLWSAEKVVDEEVGSGRSYELKSDLFHSIDAPNDMLSASLVFAAPPTARPARVLGAPSGAPSYRFLRNRVDERVVEKYLCQLQELLRQ